ncbi:MFS transporter [Paenibacillus tyrfis]|uniref:MFS transporter n=1 Tax=Paenibacillus tyrfis TaxID=1501230 RepID=UPI00209EE586|nr:MFS transporter [Paenibacillus tyrfis]MCP1312430.1 MFS transporter [Paenibacillus tyrfis]
MKSTPRLSNKQMYLYTITIFLAAINMRPAITSVAPLLETIRGELGMNSSAVSFLTAIPVLCMGIFAPFAAKLGRRWGIERVIPVCLLLVGIATVARIFTNSSFLLLMTAGLIGVGVAIAGPLISGFIKLHFHHMVATMIGIYSIGMGLGASLGAGLTIPFQHLLKDSWPSALAIWSILAVVALLFWVLVLSQSQKGNAKQNAVSEGNIPLKNKRAWMLLIFFALQAGVYYSIATWLAPKAQELGLQDTTAGAVVTTFTLLQMCFSLVIPAMANRTTNRKPWLIGCSVILLIGLCIIIFSQIEAMIWFSAAIMGIGSAGLFSFALILPLDETKNPQEATAWTAMVQSGGYLLGGLLPIFSGWLRDIFGHYHYSFFGIILLSVVMLLVTIMMGAKHPNVESEPRLDR